MHAKDLGNAQAATYFKLMRACSALFMKSFDKSELEDVRLLVVDALAHVEMNMPSSEGDAKLHNILHLASKLCDTGPAYTVSMFVYESMFGAIMKKLLNMQHPEANILHCLADLQDAATALESTYDDDPSQFADMANDGTCIEYWMPGISHMYESPVVLPLQRDVVVCGRHNMDALLQLHLYYITNLEEYGEEWQSFMPEYKRRLSKTDSSRITSNPNGGWNIPQSLLMPAFRAFMAETAQGGRMRKTCGKYKSVMIGGHSFKPAKHASRIGNPYERRYCDSWVMAKASEGADALISVGQIKHILDHNGPDDKLRQFIIVHHWLSQGTSPALKFCPQMLMPGFKDDPQTWSCGNAWLIKEMAPVTFAMVRHYRRDSSFAKAWIALHRDVRFVQAAGYKNPAWPVGNAHVRM